MHPERAYIKPFYKLYTQPKCKCLTKHVYRHKPTGMRLSSVILGDNMTGMP